MTINNEATKQNLDKFITLTMRKGKAEDLTKGQLDDLYDNAINVFFFNDLEKLVKITDQTIDYLWCGMDPLYY